MASLSFLFLSLLLLASSIPSLSQKPQLTRRTLVLQEPDDQPITKKPTLDSKNQTKSIKPKKLNSTSLLKPTNSTKPPKPITKPANSTKPMKLVSSNSPPKVAKKSKPVNSDSIWMDLEADPDLDPDILAEFRDLPAQIHDALIPDLKKMSITSKAYIYKAHKNIAENVRPFVGKKYAPQIALAASSVFLIVPLVLLTVLICQLNSYLSLHRFLIFVQAYLAVYFLTLAVTAAVTGLEPLKLFYATSSGWYAWMQAVQMLGYLVYLLVQAIYLVVAFSGGENKNAVSRMVALGQMVVGLGVGCHYYVTVFHRAVTGDAPHANWKVHGVYAGCFLVILLLARAVRGSKKGYEGLEDGKKN